MACAQGGEAGRASGWIVVVTGSSISLTPSASALRLVARNKEGSRSTHVSRKCTARAGLRRVARPTGRLGSSARSRCRARRLLPGEADFDALDSAVIPEVDMSLWMMRIGCRYACPNHGTGGIRREVGSRAVVAACGLRSAPRAERRAERDGRSKPESSRTSLRRSSQSLGAREPLPLGPRMNELYNTPCEICDSDKQRPDDDGTPRHIRLVGSLTNPGVFAAVL